MHRVVVLLLSALAGLFLLGVILTYLQKNRSNQALLYSVNNLRELGQFSELYLTNAAIERGPADPRWDLAPDPRFAPRPLEDLQALGIVAAIPAATVGRSEVPPIERLSWVYSLLPTFNQKRQPTADWHAGMNALEPWHSGTNRPWAEKSLQVVTSYGRTVPVPAGEPGVAQVVGLAGLGADAANWQPVQRMPFVAPARAGCFRYDGPTPFPAITDGLSQTIFLADTSRDLGPWAAGGASTVRGYDDATDAPRPIGPGGQFGGNHPEGALLGFADHSVRIYTERTDRRLFAHLTTIAGGTDGPLPGE